MYRGENAVFKFIEEMLEEVNYCEKVTRNNFNKPLKMTIEDEQHFKQTDKCNICNKKYSIKDVRVRDHCHITGKYRGSAHQECNLKLKTKPELKTKLVIFHNLRGYDSHFIMRTIGEIANKYKYKNKKGEEKQMEINIIPNNMEKYMAFMLGNHLTFIDIDSFQFMSSSLNKLVSNLPNNAFKYTSPKIKNNKMLNILKRKGVYPFDYMDSFDRFDEEKLPNKDDFLSIMNGEHINDIEYEHAENVCKEFKLKTMGEYHDLYLGTDILLLANISENFRTNCEQYYGLDPCHYFTSPGLSSDAMLKMTGIELELMSDIDMFQFVEKGMRGGVSYISH